MQPAVGTQHHSVYNRHLAGATTQREHQACLRAPLPLNRVLAVARLRAFEATFAPAKEEAIAVLSDVTPFRFV